MVTCYLFCLEVLLFVNLQRICLKYEVFSSCSTSSGGGDMCEITIEGMAFLWHQVRCMVSILFLIGLHLEKPEVC